MKIWALSDPHLGFACDKPMDIFGDNWSEYVSKIKANWERLVKNDDVVLLPGDISWALKIEDAVPDLEWLGKLPGTKIIIKGNHELWWSSFAKVKSILPPSIIALQNNSVKIGNNIFCGTRGWQVREPGKPYTDQDQKIYNREVIRLNLTLNDMEKQRKPEDKVIFLTHFPPYNSRREESEFTKAFGEHKVSAVVFGHVHGKNDSVDLQLLKNGIKYYQTSTDQIGHCPVEIKV